MSPGISIGMLRRGHAACGRNPLRGIAIAGSLAYLWFGCAQAETAYRPIEPGATELVTLTGHDLTVDQLVEVARNGAPVEITAEAKRHQEDAHGLLLEAAAEGMAVPWFNRSDDTAQTIVFEGDPGEPATAANLQARAFAAFQSAANAASSPEINSEEIVRAAMVVRANTLTYSPVSAPVTEMLLNFLNDRITPAASGDPANPLANIAAAMVGRGDVYYRGVRMPADRALAQAGLTPISPTDADEPSFVGTDAFDIGRAALIVADGRQALDWADLIFAMDLNGRNGGIAPLSLPAQSNRPYKWIYWDAARILDMISGSYLFDEDGGATRIFPADLTLSATRQGATWQAWGALRDVVLIALNSSDQSLAIRVALSPRDAPELTTPQMMRFFVKGGKYSGGKRGYIVPALNRDLYPLTNEITAFAASLDAFGQALTQRTGAAPAARSASDTNPMPTDRARQTLDASFGLLALDLINATQLLDQRNTEDTSRTFGSAPTAVWAAFRMAAPAQTLPDTALSIAQQFLRVTKPAEFYPKGESPPGSDDPIPLAQERLRR